MGFPRVGSVLLSGLVALVSRIAVQLVGKSRRKKRFQPDGDTLSFRSVEHSAGAIRARKSPRARKTDFLNTRCVLPARDSFSSYLIKLLLIRKLSGIRVSLIDLCVRLKAYLLLIYMFPCVLDRAIREIGIFRERQCDSSLFVSVIRFPAIATFLTESSHSCLFFFVFFIPSHYYLFVRVPFAFQTDTPVRLSFGFREKRVSSAKLAITCPVPPSVTRMYGEGFSPNSLRNIYTRNERKKVDM